MGTPTVVFTAGDLREGLECLEPSARAAVLFGLDLQTPFASVVGLHDGLGEGLERQVSAAFGGMSWDDLLRAYRGMLPVDLDAGADSFIEAMRDQGILPKA